MSWYDTKQAAVDPDNPAANEQIPFSEWNAMVTYLKDKIINKTVNDAAIANDRILVYKTATSTFVFEDQSIIAALNSIPDVVISGVPADNEVLAYNTATSKWINQTAAEAGIALVADVVLEADFSATTFLYATTNNTPQPKTPAEVMAILSGTVGAEFLFNTQKIGGIVDPTTAQQGATKNYADTRLTTKEVVTNFTNDYVFAYKTASGKFEMVAQSGGVTDHGALTGLADDDHAQYLLVDGSRAMTSDLDMGNKDILNILRMYSKFSTDGLLLYGGDSAVAGSIAMYGKDHASVPGAVSLEVPDATKTGQKWALRVYGVSDTPKVTVAFGIDMSSQKIEDLLDPTAVQDAATKNYADTRVATKELVTSFTNDYVLAYKTASGKFEMVAQSSGGVTDHGALTGLADDDHTQYLLVGGSRVMTGNLDMDTHPIMNITHLYGYSDAQVLTIRGGPFGSFGSAIYMYGEDYGPSPGYIHLTVPNATKTAHAIAMQIDGVTDTPIIDIYHGLDMNSKKIENVLNPVAAQDAATKHYVDTYAAGEANTASNQGTAGVGVFYQKSAIDLQFKNINAGSTKITVTDDLTAHEVDIDIAPANVVLDTLGTPTDNTDLDATTAQHGLLLKLGGGSTNFLRADGTWAAPPGAAGGETNTASNTGTIGTGVFKQKTGVDLELYKLNSIDNKLTIALNGTDRMDFTVNQANINHDALLNFVAAKHLSLPNTIANVLSDHTKSAHDALSINAGQVDGCDAGVDIGKVFKIPTGITQGDLFHVNNAGNLIRIAAGTNGHFLKTQGAASDPVWAAAPGAASGGDSAYVVAANDTPSTIKARADVSCDGASDETEINTAFTTYDTVVLTEGTFVIDGPISMGSNQSLLGSGVGTVIKIKNSFNATLNMIVNSDQVSGNINLLIANLKLDGNRANQTTGNMFGVEWSKVTESMIRDCWIDNLRTDAIRFIEACKYCQIVDNIMVNNGYGPSIEGGSEFILVADNMIWKTQLNGIYISKSSNVSVKNNFVIASSQYMDNSSDQIFICGASGEEANYCDIQGNTIRDGGETNNPRYAIKVSFSQCNRTLIANNDCYDCAQTGTFADTGTNTSWGAGNRKKDGTWATGV